MLKNEKGESPAVTPTLSNPSSSHPLSDPKLQKKSIGDHLNSFKKEEIAEDDEFDLK